MLPLHELEVTMRWVLATLAVVAFTTVFDARSGAYAQGAWCSWYDAYTYNCGFYTYEQCLANIQGVGGWCAPNAFYTPRRGQDDPPPRRKKKTKPNTQS
jgi:hypothetical protein